MFCLSKVIIMDKSSRELIKRITNINEVQSDSDINYSKARKNLTILTKLKILTTE